MTTHIRGIDFTSAPSSRKAITVAEGTLEGGVLSIQELRRLPSFDGFERLLRDPGPWTAGIDFPFGQPRRLIEALGWPQESWKHYVDLIDAMGKPEFKRALRAYVEGQPEGDKEHKRLTDPSYAVSAMKLGRPPAGMMFFEGAPRIAHSGASIAPCAPSNSDRVIVEAYSAMVAKALVRKASYKEGNKEQAEGRRKSRQRIVSALSGDLCRARYGLTVWLAREDQGTLIEEPQADLLDAVLCAIQAAWASGQPGYGVPDDCDSLEGWIVDPVP